MGFRLTKSIVDSLPFPASGQSFYRDEDLKGFGLRVGSASKVYFAEGKISNRTVRVTIGKHGVFTSEQARNQARVILGQIAKGIHPNELSRAERIKRITLEEAFTDFLIARKNLAASTVLGYRRSFDKHFGDWRRKLLTDITKDMVERRHCLMGANTPAQANQSMRFLRALFNFAMGRYEDAKGNSVVVVNPVIRLSQTRAWYRIPRRQTLIKAHELGPWFRAVLDEENCISPGLRDYLLLLMLTGLRRSEGASLKWQDVDLVGRTLTIRDTKNHEDHTLPLSDFLFDLLSRRKAEASNEFVFPGGGRSGHIYEPRKYMDTITAATGIVFTLHDLRRTFITVAESLDIPAYALKRLLNHKMSNDVTAGYIIADAERLRVPMQRITDYMLRKAGVIEAAEVIQIARVISA
jgi:integrase